MVDEGIVSFSVAAGFLVAIPLCALQGGWLVEWSFGMFVITWFLAFLTAYPFVCALLNIRFLLTSPDDAYRAAAGTRMEVATIAVGAFGVICMAILTSSLRAGSGISSDSTGALAIAGFAMLACLIWYAAARFWSRSRFWSASVLAALMALFAMSIALGLLCTVGAEPVWKILVLLYPLNLLLVAAKLAKAMIRTEDGAWRGCMRRRFRR